MFRLVIAFFLAVESLALTAAPVPKGTEKATGIFVLDDCDPIYQGKVKYDDNLTFLDSAGKQTFRISGFNNCNSIGSSRMIATDATRNCVWVLENVANRIRRFDLTGKETLIINGVKGSAVAIDQETGNVWAVVGPAIGSGKTVVYDGNGKVIASYELSGWDIVYDKSAKAFWIVDRKLTKISAAEGKVLFTKEIAVWTASSLDVDSKTGSAWVAIRRHPQVANSANKLVKFSADGKEIQSIDLGDKSPWRVSASRRNGGAWVAAGKTVEFFSSEGKSEALHDVVALAVQTDPASEDIWVVTATEIQKMNPKGEVLATLKHAGKTKEAWIAAFE